MSRGALIAFSLVVLVAAVGVGPLGGGSAQPSVADQATVTLVSPPSETVVFEPGRFGSARYRLDAPQAVINVANVTGTPTLRYTVDIPGAWFTVISRYDLAGRDGNLTLAARPTTLSPDRLEQTRYEAMIAIWLRTDTRERAILQQRVTVEVRP